jgi:hypothetical protein
VTVGETLGPLTLIGYDLDTGPQGAMDGSPAYLTLYWRASRDVPVERLTARLEVIDSSGRPILSQDLPPARAGYPTTDWAAGEVLRAPHLLPIPASAPPGPARMQLSLVDDAGGLVAGPVELAQIEIQAPARSTERPEIKHPLERDFGGAIRLLGYDLEPASGASAGQTLRLTLYWESLAPVSQSYTVFTHLLDGEGRIWAQRDSLPLGGARPTTGWLPGEVLVDVYELEIQADAPPGEYTLEAGLYEAGSGARLPVLGADGQPAGDHAVLTRIAILLP